MSRPECFSSAAARAQLRSHQEWLAQAVDLYEAHGVVLQKPDNDATMDGEGNEMDDWDEDAEMAPVSAALEPCVQATGTTSALAGRPVQEQGCKRHVQAPDAGMAKRPRGPMLSVIQPQ